MKRTRKSEDNESSFTGIKFFALLFCFSSTMLPLLKKIFAPIFVIYRLPRNLLFLSRISVTKLIFLALVYSWLLSLSQDRDNARAAVALTKIRCHASKRTKSAAMNRMRMKAETRKEYMEGEESRKGRFRLIYTHTHTHAHPAVLCWSMMAWTCASRSVKTCHARFAASFGSKKGSRFLKSWWGWWPSFSTR